MEAMGRGSIQEVRVGAPDSTLSSSSTHVRNLDSPIASNNSDFDSSVGELFSTKHRLGLAEDAISLMDEQVQSQGPWLHKVEAPHVAAKAMQGAVESNAQSSTTFQ